MTFIQMLLFCKAAELLHDVIRKQEFFNKDGINHEMAMTYGIGREMRRLVHERPTAHVRSGTVLVCLQQWACDAKRDGFML